MPLRLRPPAVLVLVALLVALGALAASAEGGPSLGERKRHVDASIDRLQGKISAAKRKEGVLTSQIESVSGKIHGLESDIGVLSTKVSSLEAELASSRQRLAILHARYDEQTRRLSVLHHQHDVAQHRLGQRLVELYETGGTDEVALLFQAGSIAEVLDQAEYFDQIGRQDRAIANEIARLQEQMRISRAKTAATKKQVTDATAALAAKTAAERAARDRLVSQQEELAGVRADKRSLLAQVREGRHEDEEDLKQMKATSAAIAAKIQAAQSQAAGGSTGHVSSSGLAWPLQGVLTSGFGYRWGRMHEGIDIAAPIGTPIHAAAAGTVIYAGWMSGYGNIVIIDHGNGIATAYGHQSAIYVTSGHVEQGQVIGAVGSTGHSTGPHCHFEVRVNGVPVNPLNYL